MKFEMISARTLSRTIEGNHVAAVSHYQAELRDVLTSVDDDGSAPR